MPKLLTADEEFPIRSLSEDDFNEKSEKDKLNGADKLPPSTHKPPPSDSRPAPKI
jgi:hypothetical protein